MKTLPIIAGLTIAFALAAFAPSASAVGVGQRCGGFVGIKCNKGLWCQKPGGQCFFADSFGTCARAPRFCPLIFKPVCGCDGKTYANDCQRQSKQVQLSHPGRCW